MTQKKTLERDTHFTLSADDSDGSAVNDYTITFRPSAMSDYAGKTLVITYDAVVLASAANEGKASNTAKLTYSNKIKDTNKDGNVDESDDGAGDKNYIEDRAVVYNYKIIIQKYKDSVDDANKLGNNESVQFELYTSATGGTAMGLSGSPGSYHPPASGESSDTTLTTGTNGALTISGLTAGTYYLQEVKTISNYNLLKGRVAVDLKLDTETTWITTDDFNDGTLTKRSWSSVAYSNTSDVNNNRTNNYVSKDIINKAGFTLPQTGGMGTFLFSIVGAILMIGGGFILLRSYKKKSA